MNGAIRKSFRDFLIGLFVFLTYSSIFWGIFPVDEHVSWESHLFGLITGITFGFIDSRLADEVVVEATDEEKESLIA